MVLRNHAHPNNPLHPQEQVMNKYAVVVSLSYSLSPTLDWCVKSLLDYVFISDGCWRHATSYHAQSGSQINVCT